MQRLWHRLPVALVAWTVFSTVPVLPQNSTGGGVSQERIRKIEDRLDTLEARLDRLIGLLEAKGEASKPTEVQEPVANRLEALDQKVRALEKQKESESAAAPAQPKDIVVATAGREGFGLKSESQGFQVKVGGYLQTDGRFYFGDGASAGTDTLLIRRARPVLQGTVFKAVDFRIMPDFGGGQTVLQDAYFDFRVSPKFVIRAGKFKAPFGLERLQSAADINFVERAFPTSIAPNRDEGVEAWGDLASGQLSYAVGVFNGTPDGGSVDVDTNNSKELVARAFVTPFAKAKGDRLLKGFGGGLAISYTDQAGAFSTYKTSGQLGFFSYSSGVAAAGDRFRYSPQFYYYRGPLGVLGEYVRSQQDVRKGAAVEELSHESWQLALSYFLTGERKAYRGVAPLKSVEPGGGGGWGAWEVKARFSDLRLDPHTFSGGFADPAKSAREARAWALGLNWYLNRAYKFVFDYEQTSFRGGAAIGDRPTEQTILTRLQVAF